MNNFFEKLTQKVHNIFLLDAIGAFSSILWLALLYSFDEYFGMPQNVLLKFIYIASFLFLYSTTIFIFKPSFWKLCLKVVIFLNLSYSLLTIIEIYINRNLIKPFGYLYFLIEILIIIFLVIYELKFIKK